MKKIAIAGAAGRMGRTLIQAVQEAKGLELGAFFYLLKPVNLEELCHKIEDARRQKKLETKGM